MPKAKEPNWPRYIAGGLGSCSAELVTLPIDLTKLRLQLQANKQYSGMCNAFSQISKQEGLFSLWKGGAPALLRQASYSTIRMGVYEPIRDFLAQSENPTFVQRLLAGGTAGAIGIAICNPIEVVKIRMQADITRTRYHNMSHAFRSLFLVEGVTAGWRGLVPNISRVFVTNASEIAAYDQSKQYLVDYFQFSPTKTSTHFIASIVAGFIGAVASSPADIVKNRLMNQQVGTSSSYNGIFDCIIKVARNEGLMAFYKGFIPLWMRLAPWNVVMWISYEKYRKSFELIWNK